MPDADRPAEGRRPGAERARQHVWRQRAPAVALRADDLHAVEFDAAPAPRRSTRCWRRKIGGNSRFRSLQIGVSQESFGGAIQKNMSWAGPNRPLPPEEIPHRLFDRLFGARDLGWVNRKRSILDALAKEGALLRKGFPRKTRCGWTSTSRRSAIWSAPSRPCRRTTRRSLRPKRTST